MTGLIIDIRHYNSIKLGYSYYLQKQCIRCSGKMFLIGGRRCLVIASKAVFEANYKMPFLSVATQFLSRNATWPCKREPYHLTQVSSFKH